MDFKKKPKVKRVSSVKKTPQKQSADKQISLDVRAGNLAKNIEILEKTAVGHVRTFFVEKFPNLKNVRNLVLVWLFLMVGLLLSVAVFRIYGDFSYKAETFSDGGTYSEGIIGEIKSLNPIFASSEPEKAFAKLAFSSLYTIDTSGKLNTELARSVSTTDGYKTFSLKIRENAVWSDGQKLTADDVIFTVGLLKNRLVNVAKYDSWADVKVSRVGDFEIKFEMPTASDLVLYTLDFPVLPKHKFENIQPEQIRENIFSKNPVTSGKFAFKSLAQSENKTTILLEKNEKYFGGAAKLDRFEIVAYSEKAQLVKALASGEISASPSVSLSDFSDQEKPKMSENQSEINRGTYAFLNNSSTFLKDRAVRLALQKGIDVSLVRSKMSSISALDFPIFAEYVDQDAIELPQYNLEEAKKMLDEAGWKLEGSVRTKDGQKMKMTLATVSGSNLEAAAKEFKRQLELLGAEIELIVADGNDKSGSFFQSILQPRNYDILIYEIDFGADSDIYAFWHSSQATANGFNFSNYADAIADDILLNSREAETDSEKRDQLTAFVKRWLSRAPAIGISQTKETYVFRKSVKTYDSKNILTEALDRYGDVLYWQVDKTELYKTP